MRIEDVGGNAEESLRGKLNTRVRLQRGQVKGAQR